MRPEQKEAVERTAAYFRDRAGGDRSPKFLWNAKMRFGKTFAAYQLAREMGWKRVLVLTYKPAVQSAWRDDLLGHVDFSGWHFVDRETPIADADRLLSGPDPVVRFASFQDLGQKSHDGEVKEHNESIHLTDWDCIVLDEYHFGAWRDSARELYDPADKALAEEAEPEEEVTEEDLGLDSGHYLYLSGTPFRAITNGEFTKEPRSTGPTSTSRRRRTAGTRAGVKTLTSSCRKWRCTPMRLPRERRDGPRKESSRASR